MFRTNHYRRYNKIKYCRSHEVTKPGLYFVVSFGKKWSPQEFTKVTINTTNGKDQLICWLTSDIGGELISSPYRLDEIKHSLFHGPLKEIQDPHLYLINEMRNELLIKDIIE